MNVLNGIVYFRHFVELFFVGTDMESMPSFWSIFSPVKKEVRLLSRIQ